MRVVPGPARAVLRCTARLLGRSPSCFQVQTGSLCLFICLKTNKLYWELRISKPRCSAGPGAQMLVPAVCLSPHWDLLLFGDEGKCEQQGMGLLEECVSFRPQ